ncbi:MAG: FAD-dependent oxidoreductase [Thiohalophilus sp.]|nr:FAD-dependent oxidoreductase [Thiohalophilus sp.]MDZ7661898.1 FAD-dependent oxidoreductase [Thiohalophilus sp.]MDZ7803765.1 FAD-dependent oxidoreductase [Thiohalophilus sp.]
MLNELAARIKQQGGNIHLSTPVRNVRIENDRVTGIELNSGLEAYDQIISTIPLQYIPRLIPDLPGEQLERYRQVQNIGVVCLIYKLKKPVTDNFWLNISDPDFDIPGIIEMSNLRPLSDNVVYVPYYMPRSHPKFSWSDEKIINEATGYLKKLNPELGDEDIISVNASRYAYAQPICQPGFASLLPPIRGNVDNLLIADTSYYYPEDRSMAESVKLGRQLAKMAQS